MKDETCGVPIKMFVESKAKMYSFTTDIKYDPKKILKKHVGYYKCNKAQGVNKNVVDDEIKFKACKNGLFNGLHMRHEMNRIQSKDHQIGTYRKIKPSFSCYDDENIYLKMDTVDYHIFINLLVNHTKIILSNIDNLF